MTKSEIDEIRKALNPFSLQQEANAAVAILLKPENEDLNVLLVKRIEDPHDPWSGQIALPGGKRILRDRDLVETVHREMLEETGIDLLDGCRFLGVTAAVRSSLNPKIKVLPFVFLLEHKPQIRLNKSELEKYYWISISELIRNERPVEIESEIHPAFAVGDLKIWGLTFRILKGFLRVISKEPH